MRYATGVIHLPKAWGPLCIVALLACAANALAISGNNVPDNQLPDQSCKISYFLADGTRNGLCSGTLISKNQILTAIHCEDMGQAAAETEISCGRAAEVRHVVSRVRNPAFDDRGIYFGVFDEAILTVDQDLTVEPIQLPRSTDEIGALVSRGSCGVFGYGLSENWTDAGILRGGVGRASSYIDDNRSRTVDGRPFNEERIHITGVATRPGDSGGGLYCKRMSHGSPVGNWILSGLIVHDGDPDSIDASLAWISAQAN